MSKHTVVWEGVREQCVLVSDAISSSISSLVGPGIKLKSFIDADGNGVITRSIVRILDNLDVEEHPVGMAYKQITEGYLNYVGESGLSSMLTLLGLLVKMGDILEKKGIPLVNVLEGFRIGANICEETLHAIAIPFSTIHNQLHNTSPNNSDNGIDTGDIDLQTVNLNRFSSDSFLSGPKINKGNSELLVINMLSKLGITTPPVIAEMNDGNDDNDDVSWFFDGNGVDEENSGNSTVNELDSSSENALLDTSTIHATSTIQASSLTKGVESNIGDSNSIIAIISRGLAHGNEEMMAIAVRVAQILEDEWETEILKRQVNFEHSSVTNGLIIPLQESHTIATCSCKGITNSIKDKNNPSIGQEANTRQWCGRVAVLDGDAGASEHFQGANREINAVQFVQIVKQREQGDEKYNRTVLSGLMKHDVKLVIASGEIKQSLAEMLHFHGIHLTYMKNCDWSFVCRLTQFIPIGDLLDITEDFLSPFVRIETFAIGGKWKEIQGRRFKTHNLEFKQDSFIRITPIDTRPLNFPISVVFGGATKAIGEEKERQFMNCLHKLRNSCQLEQVLPGGGHSELRCMAMLEDHVRTMTLEGSAESKKTGLHYILYEAEAVNGFMECIEQYMLILARNIGSNEINPQDAIDVVAKLTIQLHELGNESVSLYHYYKENEESEENGENEKKKDSIYDDMLAKIEGFQRAVISASIILNINTMVIEKKNLKSVNMNET